MTPDEAQAALGSVGQTELRMADRMRWPMWRHAAFGALMVLVLAALVLPDAGRLAAFGLVIALTAIIIRDDRKRHGMYVSGYQRGTTGWVLALSGLAFVGGVFAMNALSGAGPTDAVYWLLLGATFVIQTALSYLWQWVYQADLRQGRA